MTFTETSIDFHYLSAKQLAKFQHGSLVQVTGMPSWNIETGSAYSHPEGLILRRGSHFQLNGHSIWKPENGYRFVYQTKAGIIVYDGKYGYLNGAKLVAQTEVTPRHLFPFCSGAYDRGNYLQFQDVNEGNERKGFESVEVPKDRIDQWEPAHWGILIRKDATLLLLILKDVSS